MGVQGLRLYIQGLNSDIITKLVQVRLEGLEFERVWIASLLVLRLQYLKDHVSHLWYILVENADEVIHLHEACLITSRQSLELL